MISFLKFIEQSTDEEFEKQLPKRLDVPAFARYLAFQNLVSDPDSLAGTGNNYYFLYDARKRQFSISSWDQNLAFGRIGFNGATYKPYYEDGAGIPMGIRNLNIPGLKDLVQGEGLGEPNVLVTRFLATTSFRALYDRTYRELFDQILVSGRADDLLVRFGAVIRTANADRPLVDGERFEGDLTRNRKFLVDRLAFLRTVAPTGDPAPPG